MANNNVVESNFGNYAEKVKSEDKYCPHIISSKDDVESTVNDSFDFASHFTPPIHPFLSFPPHLVDPMMINTQQLRATKKQVKILTVAMATLTLAVLALTGFLIYSHLPLKPISKILSSPHHLPVTVWKSSCRCN